MAPYKPPGDIKIIVPRHNAPRIGPKLRAEIKKAAKSQRMRVDPSQPRNDITLAHAAESASDWNSLLMTARAERGPQWDVATQQFLVDKGSELYYDATPLFEVLQQERGEQSRSRRPSTSIKDNQPFLASPHPASRSNSQHGTVTPSYPYGQSPTSSRFTGPGFNTVAPGPGQFYNGRAGSPARMGMGEVMGSMGGMPMAQGVRRSTRGIPDDAFHGM